MSIEEKSEKTTRKKEQRPPNKYDNFRIMRGAAAYLLVWAQIMDAIARGT